MGFDMAVKVYRAKVYLEFERVSCANVTMAQLLVMQVTV